MSLLYNENGDVRCESCKGNGVFFYTQDSFDICKECDGWGWLDWVTQARGIQNTNGRGLVNRIKRDREKRTQTINSMIEKLRKKRKKLDARKF